ncbi:hypothetical protein HC931_26460 [Candidatus Gracilibacteria bacterium]|jgi:hypothetical protein|nr:hypothetical protein [Candidatus Gracilibacteria bacterium]NJM89944.1 hypothetical protein [Hydrococcus sp. RU_2_2]NJP22212.1 hypothetical protein [Hydrococcus sp. CRU_1_1]
MTAFGFIFDLKPRTKVDDAIAFNKIIDRDLVTQKESCKKVSHSTSGSTPIISIETHGVDK